MIFSAIRECTAVTEMGRKSLGCVGPVFLGTGQILACFHCLGTMDMLTRSERRSAAAQEPCGQTIQAGISWFQGVQNPEHPVFIEPITPPILRDCLLVWRLNVRPIS